MMVRVLLVCLAMLCAWQPVGGATATGARIFEPFDPTPLAPAEVRFLQAALAATGTYAGPLDGLWGTDSAAALARFAGHGTLGPDAPGHAPAGVGPDGPLAFDAAALVLAFLDTVRTRGWDLRPLPGLGVSIALPFADLKAPEDEEGDRRRWTRDGRFTILTRSGDRYAADAWHAAAIAANAADGTLVTVREPDRLVTAGTLADGRGYYTRSDRTDDGWTTIYLAADPDDAGTLALAAASIRPGRPLPWTLPDDGALAALVADTRAFFALDADSADGTSTADPGLLPETSMAAALPQPDEATTTGTAFYLGARTLVTAGHVVAACHRISLADGTPLEVLATDPDLDVAALAAPRPAPRWLSLAADAPARLGQRVHAAGFPYYAIAGTSLHLTGGNVSALAGIDDDSRFFSFTAPVQPGNSGGPLIDADGGVLGLVVARLSEDFIVEETGSFPQNVNYALSEHQLATFLAAAGVAPGTGGLGRFDMDEGVPDGFSTAVVPIVCR